MKAKHAKKLVKLLAKELGKHVADHMDSLQFDVTLRKESETNTHESYRYSPLIPDEITITKAVDTCESSGFDSDFSKFIDELRHRVDLIRSGESSTLVKVRIPVDDVDCFLHGVIRRGHL